MKHCSTFLTYNDVHYHIPPVVVFPNGKKNQTTQDGLGTWAKADFGETEIYKEGGRRGS